VPHQNCRRQEGEMIQLSYWGSTILRRHRKKKKGSLLLRSYYFQNNLAKGLFGNNRKHVIVLYARHIFPHLLSLLRLKSKSIAPYSWQSVRLGADVTRRSELSYHCRLAASERPLTRRVCREACVQYAYLNTTKFLPDRERCVHCKNHTNTMCCKMQGLFMSNVPVHIQICVT
jgi:hypothetical protein